MHEESIARRVWREAERIAAQHGGEVVEVRVELGPLAGVEGALLAAAFERITSELTVAARLTIDEAPMVLRCRDCSGEGKTRRFDFACPTCGSAAVAIVSGDQLQLISVTLSGANGWPNE